MMGLDLEGKDIKKMRHALGLDYTPKRDRNYYFVYKKDGDWEKLVARGFADVEVSTSRALYGFIYSVTEKGRDKLHELGVGI